MYRATIKKNEHIKKQNYPSVTEFRAYALVRQTIPIIALFCFIFAPYSIIYGALKPGLAIGTGVSCN